MKAPDWPWWDLESKTFVKFDDGEETFDWSSNAQVSRAVMAVVLEENLEETRSQYVCVRSGRLTLNKVLEMIQQRTVQGWTVVANQAQAVRDQGAAIFEKWTREQSLKELTDNQESQLPVGMMITGGTFGLRGVCRFAEKAAPWMRKLGLEQEDADVVLRDHIQQGLTAA